MACAQYRWDIQSVVKCQCIQCSSMGARVQANRSRCTVPLACVPRMHLRDLRFVLANVCKRMICTVLPEECSRWVELGQMDSVARLSCAACHFCSLVAYYYSALCKCGRYWPHHTNTPRGPRNTGASGLAIDVLLRTVSPILEQQHYKQTRKAPQSERRRV